jgi:hypothetical protein
MFKKSNRNFKAKKVDSSNSDQDEDEIQGNGKETLIETHIKSRIFEKSKEKTLKVLNFEDGDNSGETEFKVKKSKESRRIAKELKHSRKERKNIDENIAFKNNTEVNRSEIGQDSKFKGLNSSRSYYKKNYQNHQNEKSDEDEFKDYKNELWSSSSDSENDEFQKQKNKNQQESINEEDKRLKVKFLYLFIEEVLLNLI